MNPIAFMLAVSIVVVMFVVYQHMLNVCFTKAVNAYHWQEKVFQCLLGVLLCVGFVAIAFGVLVVGTLPAHGPSKLF